MLIYIQNNGEPLTLIENCTSITEEVNNEGNLDLKINLSQDSILDDAYNTLSKNDISVLIVVFSADSEIEFEGYTSITSASIETDGDNKISKCITLTRVIN